MITTEPAVPDPRLLNKPEFCILVTCIATSTKISLDVILHPRLRAFDSVELLCARKKGTGVKNDSIYAVFLEYGKIKQAKETLCSQGAFPGEEFTTIRNIVEAVIC